MSKQARAQYKITGWDEKTWDGKGWKEIEGTKLTLAKVSSTYEGDLVGSSTMQYLMYYREDGWVTFTGYEQFIGTMLGKTGSFVLETSGTVVDGIVHGKWTVVAGSGTDALKGLIGTGSSSIDHAESYPFTLDYEFV